MRKRQSLKVIFVLFGLLLTAVPAHSHELTLGADISSFAYDEILNDPYKSSERATVVSPVLSFRYDLSKIQNVYLKTDLSYADSTSSNFNGTTIKGTPVQDTNYLTFFRGEETFYFSTLPSTYLFVGLGYRYWNRFLSGGAGYREIYTWTYLPFGIYFEFVNNPRWRAGLELSYRQMLSGQIKVIFTETVSGGDDSTMTLGNKGGFKIQAPMLVPVGLPVKLSLIPWYEFSQIGESEFEFNATPQVNDYIQEPNSRTEQFGLTAGLTWQF